MLTVETGTGSATSDSYSSLADAAAYATARGLTFAIAGDDEALAEQALRRAAPWLDAYVLPRLAGTYRTNQRDQALAFPRAGLIDREGNGIGADEIPVEIKNAAIEAAVIEKATPNTLSPEVTPGQIKKRVRVEGAVEVEYAVGSANVASQQLVATRIDNALAPLLGPRPSGYFGKAVRG